MVHPKHKEYTFLNIFVIGTRAQLIKVAPVIRIFEMSNRPVTFILTGQHNDTMQDLIGEFGITTPPMQLIKNKEHASIFALLFWIPSIFILLYIALNKFTYSYVFVHGDTLTTLLSTFAAKLTKNKIVHLESGLTSKTLLNPFPEEIIRRIVFRYTDIAFCPSLADMENMQKYANMKIFHTNGNTILDSIKYLKVGENISFSKNTIVVSLHRFQNIYSKKRLTLIINSLLNLSDQFQIKFVLHPATQEKLIKFNLLAKLESNPNIHLLARMTYKKFLNLALSSNVVITDGGSNQEELAFFGHPTIILRETTERQDGLAQNAILIESPHEVENFIFQRKYKILNTYRKTLNISPSECILNSLPPLSFEKPHCKEL